MTNKETELACLSAINSLAMAAKALEQAAHVIKKIHQEAVYPDLKLVENDQEK